MRRIPLFLMLSGLVTLGASVTLVMKDDARGSSAMASQARSAVYNPAELEAGFCSGPDCQESRNPLFMLASANRVAQRAVRSRYRSEPLASGCFNMIRPDGSYGSWGHDIARVIMNSRYRELFLRDNALGRLCPRFNSASMTEGQKLAAWVFFWQVLANAESSCIVDKDHPTHDRNGRVINPRRGHGLWAMEKYKRDRDRAQRGPECERIDTVEEQARCTIDIMGRQSLSQGGTIFSGNRYWGPLRDGRDQIQLLPNMTRFSACFEETPRRGDIVVAAGPIPHHELAQRAPPRNRPAGSAQGQREQVAETPRRNGTAPVPPPAARAAPTPRPRPATPAAPATPAGEATASGGSFLQQFLERETPAAPAPSTVRPLPTPAPAPTQEVEPDRGSGPLQYLDQFREAQEPAREQLEPIRQSERSRDGVIQRVRYQEGVDL